MSSAVHATYTEISCRGSFAKLVVVLSKNQGVSAIKIERAKAVVLESKKDEDFESLYTLIKVNQL